MKQLPILALTLVFAFFTTNAQWTKGKGNGYYKLSAWYLEANQHFTSNGEIDPNATRGQFNLNLYGEYGLSNNLDLVAYVPFFSRNFQNDILSGTTGDVITQGEAINSIGDVDLGIRYGFIKKEKVVASIGVTLGLPTGNSQGGSDGSYQTGDGEFNQMIRASVGLPFKLGNTEAYSKSYIGFNNRTENFSDELRLGTELGFKFIDRLWILGRIDIVESLKNGSLNAQNSQGSIFANNIEFMAAGVEAAYSFSDKWGVSANYTSAFRGEIVFAAPSYSAGIFLNLR